MISDKQLREDARLQYLSNTTHPVQSEAAYTLGYLQGAAAMRRIMGECEIKLTETASTTKALCEELLELLKVEV